MKIPAFPEKLTIQAAYAPAMRIEDEDEAQAWLEALIVHQMRSSNSTWEEAERIEKENLWFYSSRHDEETRERVNRLFKLGAAE